jgi:fibronectin-binding autotransporter adhesin
MNAQKGQRSGWFELWPAIVLILGITATRLALSPAVVGAAGPLVVTNLLDNGSPGTLRWAIDQANDQPGPDSITFEPQVTGTIALTDALPAIVDTLTIEGPGADILAVSGGWDSGGGSGQAQRRVFDIGSDTAVTISAVTVRDGWVYPGDGAGIRSAGMLVLKDTDVLNNHASWNDMWGGYGGGLYIGNGGSATVTGAHISGNFAGAGGGIYAEGSVMISGTQISNNRAGEYHGTSYGGGLWISGADVRVSGSQISDNRASAGGGVYVNGGNLTMDEGEISNNVAWGE